MSAVSKERNARETASKRVQELSKQKMDIESSLKKERLKTQEIQQENESLKAEWQAKLAQKAKEEEAVKVAQAPKHAAPLAVVSGNKADWLAQSGIPQHEWGYVDSIVSRESGWNPNAVNPSSGACGLGQQLPCGKWSGAWNDPVAALRAQYGYVVDRYGSYAGAVAFWNANHWY